MSDLKTLCLDQESTDLSAEQFYLQHEKALKGTEERFLNGENTDDEGWRSEALAVIADIQKFVNKITISTVLPCDVNGVYMNLETQEGTNLTVELSAAGFRVCGHQFDTLEVVSEEDKAQADQQSSTCTDLISLAVYYETPYSLLDSISPSYRDSFSNELAQRLKELCK
ncbi:PREDICTED: GSK3-beta interaction protein [Rhagoletis zephyria]|uniref:GSK3-beta interaction protein n=1 Tax=Rhagoletis zephyria TaxID=28612 RepID=UPI000811A699|nr:PREDICTED: GSK3-beta interaction protein [Rhagoletis zephyria]